MKRKKKDNREGLRELCKRCYEWVDEEEETNIDQEEQISQVADILFCNTETGQFPIEKCYELAEKIVAKRGANLREDETVTNCNQLEDEIDSEWAKCKPIDEGMGLESATIVNEQFYDIARHFAKWGAEHLIASNKMIGDHVADDNKMVSSDSKISNGLEEAAEEYAWQKEEPLAEGERLSTCFNPRIESFKAGAEWHARQGQTLESVVWKDSDDVLFVDAFVDENKFKMADIVTIQVVKKH